PAQLVPQLRARARVEESLDLNEVDHRTGHLPPSIAAAPSGQFGAARRVAAWLAEISYVAVDILSDAMPRYDNLYGDNDLRQSNEAWRVALTAAGEPCINTRYWKFSLRDGDH